MYRRSPLVPHHTTACTVFGSQVDKFSIEAIDLGQVFKIRVRHDNSLVGAAWYLDQVEVLEVETEEVYMFLCERWLSTKKEDKCIDRTFFVKVSRTFSGGFQIGPRFDCVCSLQTADLLFHAVCLSDT